MEIPALQGFAVEGGLMTMEKALHKREQQQSLRIGVPCEVANEERRVAIAPSGALALVSAGHQVYVEREAGDLAHFRDDEYAETGADLVDGPGDLYGHCDLIVKVGPPNDDELGLLQEKQILISALNLGGTSPGFLRRLMQQRITGIGFEFIRDNDGTFPLVRMMHEITGSMAIQVAGRLLESNEGGKGVMLGGISGVPPATVVILGAGVVGEWAARTALGYGAHVIVLDTELGPLRSIEHSLDRRVTTAMASEHYIRRAVTSADVVIGAMMSDGQRSPMLVTEEMVAAMPSGAVVVDAVMDQGGCIETSRPTSHSSPHLPPARGDALLRPEHAFERRPHGQLCPHACAGALPLAHRRGGVHPRGPVARRGPAQRHVRLPPAPHQKEPRHHVRHGLSRYRTADRVGDLKACRVPRAACRVSSVEGRVSRVECRRARAACRVPSAECRVSSVEGRVLAEGGVSALGAASRLCLPMRLASSSSRSCFTSAALALPADTLL